VKLDNNENRDAGTIHLCIQPTSPGQLFYALSVKFYRHLTF